MVIQIDTREKAKAIKNILAYFDAKGIRHVSTKLYVGDYATLANPGIVIDRKQNLSELCNNVSANPKKNPDGSIKRTEDGRPMTEWLRFTSEMEKANELGVKMIILCEHGGRIHSLQDVRLWKNPRLKDSPLAMSGERLCKKLILLQDMYGVRFEFCDKLHTGRKIVELLEAKDEPS